MRQFQYSDSAGGRYDYSKSVTRSVTYSEAQPINFGAPDVQSVGFADSYINAIVKAIDNAIDNAEPHSQFKPDGRQRVIADTATCEHCDAKSDHW